VKTWLSFGLKIAKNQVASGGRGGLKPLRNSFEIRQKSLESGFGSGYFWTPGIEVMSKALLFFGTLTLGNMKGFYI